MELIFIEKIGADLYYLSNKSIGSYGCPKSHPNHSHSIITKRGGHEVGSNAIDYIANDPRAGYYKDYCPKVYALCKRLMEEFEKLAPVPVPSSRE